MFPQSPPPSQRGKQPKLFQKRSELSASLTDDARSALLPFSTIAFDNFSASATGPELALRVAARDCLAFFFFLHSTHPRGSTAAMVERAEIHPRMSRQLTGGRESWGACNFMGGSNKARVCSACQSVRELTSGMLHEKKEEEEESVMPASTVLLLLPVAVECSPPNDKTDWPWRRPGRRVAISYG